MDAMFAPRYHFQTPRGLRILGFRHDPATASNNSVRSQYPSVRIFYGDRFCFFLQQARGMNAGQFTQENGLLQIRRFDYIGDNADLCESNSRRRGDADARIKSGIFGEL